MSQLIPHESPQARQLRYDIVSLSQTLEAIEHNISAFHHALYAFEREYQNRLGDLAEAVTVLRAQLGISNSANQITPPLTQLADADYRQLKTAYRQAAKLCHPDHLPDDRREAGLQLFDALHKAYHLQDLVQVEHILWLLQSGQAFNCNAVITTPELLARRKNLLELLIVQQQDHLAQLKMREDYDVGNRDNWNILLYDYQVQLEDELAMLRGRAGNVTS